jgi:hypothetical protein
MELGAAHTLKRRSGECLPGLAATELTARENSE